MTRKEISPALMGSVLLHVTVAVMFLISWNFARDLKVGAVVPVTIVSNAPSTDIRPAIQAPEDQTAQADQPVPDAPLQSAAPEPEPVPTPPAPTPKAAKPVEKVPAVKPAPPAKPEKSLDLDALSASVSKMVKPTKPSSAAKGPARPETATVARTTVGEGVSGAALTGLIDELQRRWNPNCDVEGGRDVQVRVAFVIGAGGQVVGNVAPQIKGAQNAVSQAAAERAVRAVYAAAPFRNLPPQYYGDKIAVTFNAREACS